MAFLFRINMNLQGKNIILGVSGSIAAYKAPMIVRELIKLGAEVRVVMTPSSEQFVSRTVLMNLSKHPVAVDMFEDEVQEGGSWHIHLAHWCDAMLIAPCSATSLARLATGFYDTALSIIACALPKEIPLLIAPAMDSDMWEHPAVLRNIEILKDDGAIIIDPAYGELASGIIGQGRLPEIQELMRQCCLALGMPISDLSIDNEQGIESHEEPLQSKPLYSKHVLITAGPTYERIDDVRFIGNFSSGKMGFALAQQASQLGALVTLITGPVSLKTPIGTIRRLDIESARDMHDMVMKEIAGQDIIIMTAAVADFTPRVLHEGKIKKGEAESMQVDLVKTTDILAELGTIKQQGQMLIGFALESSHHIEYGIKKMTEKGCDMMIVNQANKPNSGFGGDMNTISIIDHSLQVKQFPSMTKHACAEAIFEHIIQLAATS
ncbi:MAG: bifunctional phosphopantothenoylcysteine decarboxylase/phosphopantothenate synthase [Ignavibacteria bacterium]|nr:bifunctional phosphopantothenoylcysteine decarboxylase/phosphopantothenate synthase [Ignavibacteria bacterium]